MARLSTIVKGNNLRGAIRLPFLLLVVVAAFVFGPLQLGKAEEPTDVVYFPETGHSVGYGFLRLFRGHGGLDLFGYPRTEEIVEDRRTVQYFQRARFEYWPEHAGTPYEVQLTLLGNLLTTGRVFARGEPFPDSEDHRYFPETGHGVHFGFLRFFQERGGLDVFGYPISEELYGEGGWPHAVQYFQRARFEYHSENAGTPYEVQLGLLGDEYLMQRGRLPWPVLSGVQALTLTVYPDTQYYIARSIESKPLYTSKGYIIVHSESTYEEAFVNLPAFGDAQRGKTLNVSLDKSTGCGPQANLEFRLVQSRVGEIEPGQTLDYRRTPEPARWIRYATNNLTWTIEPDHYFIDFYRQCPTGRGSLSSVTFKLTLE